MTLRVSSCLFVLAAVVPVLVAGCLGPSTSHTTFPGETTAEGRTRATSGPGAGAGAGDDGSHVHDYWDGADSALLLDENVPVMLAHNHLFDEPPHEQHTHGCDETAVSTSQGGSRKFGLPPGITVFPGTERLEFTFEWTDPSITALRFLYRPAGHGHAGHDDHDARTFAGKSSEAPEYQDGGAIESGATFTVPLMPEMADDGHALRSQWAFFLCADNADGHGLAQGTVDTLIVAKRAATLPRAPPHPDHWQDRVRVPLGKASWEGMAWTALNKGDDAWLQIPFDAGALVPPGATRVVVDVNVTWSDPMRTLDRGTLLLYWQDSTVAEWIYQKSQVAQVNGSTYTFVVPVAEDGVDGVYAGTSNWDLWVRVLSERHTETPVGEEGAPFVFDGSLEAHAWAEAAP